MKNVNIALRTILLIVIALSVSYCNNRPELTWDFHVVERPTGAAADDQVDINIPVATGSIIADSINYHIEKYLSSFFGVNQGDFESSLNEMFLQKSGDTLISHINYSLIGNGEIKYYKNVISVVLDLYQFTGGAHGMSAKRVLNFDAKSGKLLSLDDIFKTDKLRELNIGFFRNSYGDDEDFITGLFIDIDTLPLPANIALDSNNAYFYYNQYEIAPYSYGVLGYEVPIEELKPLLK